MKPFGELYFSIVADDLNVLISVGNSAIVEAPRNEVILDWQSKAIDLACMSDRKIPLKLFENKDLASAELIYSGFSLTSYAKSFCTVIVDGPGKVYLSLMNKPDAAKTYTCLEPGTLAEASADIIWIGNLFSAT